MLKVKPEQKMNLIALGCFTGDEKMFRLTKGTGHTCTVWCEGDNHYSWQWGGSSRTLVCDQMEKQGRMIQSCIENDFKIKL